MPGTVIGVSMNYGYPGQISRHGDEVSRTRPVKASTSNVKFGAPVVQNTDGSVQLFGATNVAADFAGFDELYIDIKEPLDQSSTQSVDQFVTNITSACFSKGSSSYLVIANSSNSQQSFLINDNKLGRSDSIIRRYDDKGRLINESAMRYEHLRHILQPGEFFIVEVTGRDPKAGN